MVQLTEDMIVARTRVSDMAAVKKLNCWGADLTDISVVRLMDRVEIVSLSLNHITTLSDFQYCTNLRELFVRKNKIKSLKEIIFLQDLSKIRNLWLAENPCAEGNARYRQTVIRNLPQLEKLDNMDISPEERAEAARFGIQLEEDDTHSEQNSGDNFDKETVQASQFVIYSGNEPKNFPSYQVDHHNHAQKYIHASEADHYGGMEGNQEPIYRPLSNYISPVVETRRVSRYSGDWNCPPPHREGYCGRQNLAPQRHFPHQQTYPNNKMLSINQDLRQKPKNKNSNMLSAILCLVKEIDLPSLEVVEMAVRCRMED